LEKVTRSIRGSQNTHFTLDSTFSKAFSAGTTLLCESIVGERLEMKLRWNALLLPRNLGMVGKPRYALVLAAQVALTPLPHESGEPIEAGCLREDGRKFFSKMC
jgi:hypothetical protein